MKNSYTICPCCKESFFNPLKLAFEKLQEENEKLKKQIEKMKCKQNCRSFSIDCTKLELLGEL